MEMRRFLSRMLPVVIVTAIPVAAWAADTVVSAACHCCCPICCP